MFLLTVASAAIILLGAVWLLRPLALRYLESDARAEALRPVPDGWFAEVRAGVPYIAALPPGEQALLLQHARRLLTGFRWEGCGGLELTEEMCLMIAAQAAMLTWKRSDLPFPRLRTVLVYPGDAFRSRPSARPPGPGAAEERSPMEGLSDHTGSVVLAWDSVLSGAVGPDDGENVVLHEFAHQLDFADGIYDGVPLLATAEATASWAAALTAAYESLQRSIQSGTPGALDPYALTDRAEFFAVASSTFFERPAGLRAAYPVLYQKLVDYYRQDPASVIGSGTGPPGA